MMTSLSQIPPGLVLIVAGFVLPLVPPALRRAILLIAPAIVLAMVWQLGDGVHLTIGFLGHTLEPVQADALSRLFATVFSIMALVGGLFALNQPRVVELAAAFIYAGSAIGVTFAGDLITVFMFWELMAIASTVVVWSAGSGAYKAGMRYAGIHFLGGVLLMAGVAGEVAATGNIDFRALEADTFARYLILAGFLINAGAPPLSAWLPDAYPKASWSGMVFLSAFTTKTAVFVLIRSFPGTEILIYIGLYMVFYGIVYAILENNIRRILSYSIVSQVGFMVTAVGIGSAMALNGAAAHAFVHILYKALLLMSAGSVLYMTGKDKCTDLGGLFRSMPLTCVCGVIGAFSLAAVPLTSGFPAKSLIAQGVAEAHLAPVWFLLTAASAGAFLYIGLTFPWFVFFDRDSGLRPDEPPWNMRAAMVLTSVACLAIGIYPKLLFGLLPFEVDYAPYTAAHVVFQFQLLLFSGLAFFLMLGLLRRGTTMTLDFDWFYRRFGRALTEEFHIRSGNVWAGFAARTTASARQLIRELYRHHGPQGLLGRQWPTGNMAFWMTVMLGASLVLYYI